MSSPPQKGVIAISEFRQNGLLVIISMIVFFITIMGYIVLFVENSSSLTQFDDAYMYMRYVNNLLAGKGFAWNPDGIQTFGVVTILYVAFLALLKLFISLPDQLILIYASFLNGLFSILLLVATCSFIVKDRLLKNFFVMGAILSPFLAKNPFLFHATTGMDTTLALFCNALLIASILLLMRFPTMIGCLFVVFCSYLTYLARMDNGIYAIMFPILAISLLPLVKKRKFAITLILGLLFVFVADSVIKISIFGDVRPLPYFSKTIVYYMKFFMRRPHVSTLDYLGEFFMYVQPFIFILILTCKKKHAKLCLSFFLPVFFTFLYYFTIIPIMGNHGRYYYPSLPFFIVPSIICLDDFLNTNNTKEILLKRAKNLIFRLLIIASLCLYAPILLRTAAMIYEKSISGNENLEVDVITVPEQYIHIPKLGWWKTIIEFGKIAEQFPPGTSMAATEIGYISMKAPSVPIIDLYGFHDRYIAHHGVSMKYLMAKEPDIIWFPHHALKKIINDILTTKQFWQKYDYYPGVFDYGIAIKKDSKHYTEIYKLIKESWQYNYADVKMEDCILKEEVMFANHPLPRVLEEEN